MSLSEASLPLNSVVLYEQDGEPWLALVTAFKNARYSLLNERGRTVELSLSRLSPYKIKSAAGLKIAEQQSFLHALAQQIKRISDSIELEDLWQIQHADSVLSVQQLSEIYFGSPSDEQCLAMHVRLLTQKIYFKRDREKFVPRTAEIVEELKKAEQVQAQKAQLRERFVQWIKAPSEDLPEEIKPLIDKLKRFAVNANMLPAEEREARDAAELALGQLQEKSFHKPNQIAVYNLLEKLGIFNARTNPAWIRAGLAGQFLYDNPELEADSLQREDFRNLDCFTIDDDSTQDMDDALSLELIETGYRVGIHISDVASFIRAGSELDKVLSVRMSSIYLPERTINMLTKKLSNDHFSLRQDLDRAVVSLLIDLDRELNILSYRFTPATIRVKRRWSYEQVDQMLEQTNSEFNTFYEIAANFESARIEQGALQVNKHQINIKVDDNGIVSLHEEEEHGPARSIIAEMAILYNKLCAELLQSKGIAAIFRGQEAADPVSKEEYEEERAKDYSLRVKLKPSTLSVYPQSHSSLGLKAYLQVTSPIRRYFDLVNQRQLLGLISGSQSIYDPQSLSGLIENSQDTLTLINKVSKESRRFWLLRYLEQRVRNFYGKKLGGVVVKIGPKYPLVELDEVFFCSFAKSKKKVAIGDTVEINISTVDAKEEYLRLEIL